jgi:hypothetical protein
MEEHIFIGITAFIKKFGKKLTGPSNRTKTNKRKK